MKKLFILSLISSFLYAGCSGIPLPRKFDFEAPKSELFPKVEVKPLRVGPKETSKYDTFLKGKLAGHGADFEAAAQKWNISPRILVTISIWETGNGRSHVAKAYSNIGGLMKRGKLIRFSSVKESIDYMAKNLSLNYYKQGRRTLAQIKGKYAPGGGRNSGWLVGTTKIYKTLP